MQLRIEDQQFEVAAIDPTNQLEKISKKPSYIPFGANRDSLIKVEPPVSLCLEIVMLNKVIDKEALCIKNLIPVLPLFKYFHFHKIVYETIKRVRVDPSFSLLQKAGKTSKQIIDSLSNKRINIEWDEKTNNGKITKSVLAYFGEGSILCKQDCAGLNKSSIESILSFTVFDPQVSLKTLN